ncbi:MAG: signal peptidase I, partial [Chloroflexi bacterium]|nr:signal peptidase I [Chloroflexota bacterium]
MSEDRDKGWWANARGIVTTIVLAGLVFLLVSTSFQNFKVEGSSMDPNIQNGEFLVVDKAAYRRVSIPGWLDWLPFIDRNGDGKATPFGSPQRGDVIVFRLSAKLEQQCGRNTSQNLIKRVLGLPGETVEIRLGVVYVNGLPVHEDYLAADDSPSSQFWNMASRMVPQDHYFVLGDHRSVSCDSRRWGPLERSAIIGKAW